MSLNLIEIDGVGFPMVECSICKNRFSLSMTGSWLLCCEGKKHKKMTSEEQKAQFGNDKVRPFDMAMEYAHKLNEGRNFMFCEANLPIDRIPPQRRDVTLTREKMTEFAKNYNIMLEFLALALEVPVKGLGFFQALRRLQELERLKQNV